MKGISGHVQVLGNDQFPTHSYGLELSAYFRISTNSTFKSMITVVKVNTSLEKLKELLPENTRLMDLVSPRTWQLITCFKKKLSYQISMLQKREENPYS